MDREILLNDVPVTLKTPLFQAFDDICNNYTLGHYEPASLDGGKFCEVVYTILKGYIESSYPNKPQKPKNMKDACNKLEQTDSKLFNRSIRILIPRILLSIYEIRNNRGVGHVGGDVNPNHQDSFLIINSVKWIMAELIRMFHGLSTVEAENVVDTIIKSEIPVIWSVEGKKRILQNNIKFDEKTLILLYNSPLGVNDDLLIDWVEYSNPSKYRKEILHKLHKKKYIEYNKKSKLAIISPTGRLFVEENLKKYFLIT